MSLLSWQGQQLFLTKFVFHNRLESCTWHKNDLASHFFRNKAKKNRVIHSWQKMSTIFSTVFCRSIDETELNVWKMLWGYFCPPRVMRKWITWALICDLTGTSRLFYHLIFRYITSCSMKTQLWMQNLILKVPISNIIQNYLSNLLFQVIFALI